MGIIPMMLTPAEKRIYDAGFISGGMSRQAEVDQAEADANLYYRAAYDHRNCPCNGSHNFRITFPDNGPTKPTRRGRSK